MKIKYRGRKKIVSHDYCRRRYTFTQDNPIQDIPEDLFIDLTYTYPKEYIPHDEDSIAEDLSLKLAPDYIPELGKDVREYECLYCTLTFKDADFLRKHYLEMHNDDKIFIHTKVYK